MTHPDEPAAVPEIEVFLSEPTEDLEKWARLWESDQPFPIVSHRGGVLGRLIVGCKRLLRPLVRAPQADLWERQRVFNQILIARLVGLQRSLDDLAADIDTVGKDLQQVQREIVEDMRAIQRDINGNVRGLSEDLDDFRRKGMFDVMRHTDALFSRLDQKMDRLRRKVRQAAGERPGDDASEL